MWIAGFLTQKVVSDPIPSRFIKAVGVFKRSGSGGPKIDPNGDLINGHAMTIHWESEARARCSCRRDRRHAL